MRHLFLVTTLLALIGSHSVWSDEIDYIAAFTELQSLVHWPAPNSSAEDISSTFGPRIRSSCDCYDFHRGIDIHGEVGDDVVATYDGKVKRKTTYSSGGLTLVLEHDFLNSDIWVSLHPNLGNTKRWYTLYMHLDSTTLNEGDTVEAGDVIAAVGMSGSTLNPHLHHEVRVGTRCSLEYAVDNPSSTCNTKGYDPHVHPMLVYPLLQASTGYLDLHLQVDLQVDAEIDGVISLSTPDDAANLNKYIVEIIDEGTAVLNHTLDLNLRTGYNATSTESLDTPDTNYPYLSPISFGYSATYWDMELVIPYVWVQDHTGTIKVSVYDIWGALAGSITL